MGWAKRVRNGVRRGVYLEDLKVGTAEGTEDGGEHFIVMLDADYEVTGGECGRVQCGGEARLSKKSTEAVGLRSG